MIAYTLSAETVYTVSRQLNTSLDLDEVLGRVLRLTVEATGSDRGSLFLLDEQGRVIRQLLARPSQSTEVSQRNINLVMAEGLAGWVYRHQYGALAADTHRDERWVRLPNDEEITGSALVVPLLYQERVNGLLALHHKQVRFFDESHLALAAGIAGQAAVALENARLFTQVKNERESLFAVLNAMPIPVLVINQNGLIILANKSARNSLSVTQPNTPLSALVGAEVLETTMERLKTQEGLTVEVHWPDDRYFNLSINKVPQVGTVVAMDDITDLKKLDAMKNQFVETVSHDLKNPLAVILGFAQLLEDEPNLSESGQTSLQGILESGQQMKLLITDLLDLARIEAGIGGQTKPLNLVEIIKRALLSFELQLHKKAMSLSTELPSEAVMVLGAKTRLMQVVANYVSNAIKYTPSGGNVVVQLTIGSHETHLLVTDDGPGISPAGQRQLFQKFYRVPEIHEKTGVHGTGLGLSIVKAIVESYGGRVWVESQPDQGSTFGCALPLYREEYDSSSGTTTMNENG